MSDYEYEAPAVADEMSVVASYGGGGPEVPAAPVEDVDDYGEDFTDDYELDGGDGGDWANEPDPIQELAVEAFQQRLTMQQQHEAWEADYAQRHGDAMAVKEEQASEEGYAVGDRLIDQHYGHADTNDGTRTMIWQAADAIEAEHGPGLRQQGWTDAQIAQACLTQAADLVRDAQVSDTAIRLSGLR